MAGFQFTPDPTQPEGFGPREEFVFSPDAPTEQTKALEKPVFEEGSLGDRVTTQLKGRLQNVEESSKMMAEDEQTLLEAFTQTVGQGLMAYNDAVSETTWEILGSMPYADSLDWLDDYIESKADHLMSTDTAKEIFDYYNNMDPRAQKNLDAAFNIGLSWMPIKSKVGSALTKAGEKKERKQVSQYVLDQTPTAQSNRNKELGRPPSEQRVTNHENKIVNTVLSVKGVGATTPRNKMLGTLNREISRIDQDIKKSLLASNITVPKGVLTLRLKKVLSNFKKENPEYATKHLKGGVEKVLDAYYAANKKYTGKAHELLKLRRDFDDKIRTLFEADIHAGNNAQRKVVAAIRDELNDLMQAAAPDDQIRAGMQRMHYLMLGRDNVSLNMVKDKSTTTRAKAYIEHHPFAVGGVATGTGIAGQIAENPVASELLTLFGGGALAAYGLSRPPVMKGLGATATAVNPERSMIVDALNAPLQEQPEEQ